MASQAAIIYVSSPPGENKKATKKNLCGLLYKVFVLTGPTSVT